jgi:hypothetical protein
MSSIASANLRLSVYTTINQVSFRSYLGEHTYDAVDSRCYRYFAYRIVATRMVACPTVWPNILSMLPCPVNR